MKILLFLPAFFSALMLYAVQPFNWNWSVKNDMLIVSAEITGDNFLYAEETAVKAGSLKKISSPGKKGKLSGTCQWIFSLKNAGYPLKIEISWLGCSEKGRCYLPGNAFRILKDRTEKNGRIYGTALHSEAGLPPVNVIRRVDGYLSGEDFLAFLEGRQRKGFFDLAGKNFWFVLLLSLIGGLALNLTPCILPMIPVNLAIIGAVPGKDSRKETAFLRGCTYGLGIALTYGGLGIAAIFSGSMFSWAASSWWFNMIVCIIFLFLGLAMFDVFLIDFTRYKTGFRHPDAGRLAGVFLLGVMASLLAGACVAPVVIAVLLYAANLHTWYGLFPPLALGIGMGLPWPLLGAGISVVPRPGKWMKYVKYVFGIVILGMGIHYGVSGIKLLISEKGNSRHAGTEQIRSALSTGEKPVLIGFRADWCKNCLAMERSALKNPRVRKALEKYTFLTFDATNMETPEVKPVLAHFNITGLPAFVIVRSR